MARFVPEIKVICSLLEKKGIKYSKVAGSVKDRATEIEKFQMIKITRFVAKSKLALWELH